MTDLLAHEPCSRDEAFARCERWLRSRSRAWRWLRLSVGAERRGELAALVAWHRVLRSAPHARRADLRSELERTLGEAPRTPLGIALGACVRRFALDPAHFRGPLAALEEDERTGAFTTRGELLAHAGRLAQAEGRTLLGLLEERGERARVLSDALCAGLQLARWTVFLTPELAQGRLRACTDDLFRCGVTPHLLRETPADEHVRGLVADQIAWARELLAKGWPLCRELGLRRGRALAFVLRWHAATLSALEHAGCVPQAEPRPGGWLRGLACASAAALGRPPRLERAG